VAFQEGKMKITKVLAGMFCAVTLAACGGGDSVQTPEPIPALPLASAEGIWNATTSNQLDVLATVLENGETWALYALTDGSVVGALNGSVHSVSGENVSISGSYYDMVTRNVSPLSYAGKFSARDTVQLTASTNVKLTGTYNAMYESPAALSLPVGNYTGTAFANQGSMLQTGVSISLGGLISVAASPGCTIRGVMTSRSSGRNVFNAQLNFTGSTCPMSDGTLTQGIVLYNSTSQTLSVMTLTSTKAGSYFYTGRKI